MKSLEILNSKIEKINKDLYKLDSLKDGTNKDFIIQYLTEELTEELKDYQNVKQDLEILEILKKYASANVLYTDDEEIKLKNYEVHIFVDENNKEDLDRIKQWLEENKE